MKKFIAIALSVASLVATAEMALAPGTMKHKYIAPNDYVTTNAWMTVSNKVDALAIKRAQQYGGVDSDEALGIATNAIPLWARSETKPTYTAAEVGALERSWQDESYGPTVVLLKRTMSNVTSPLFKATETPGPGSTIYSWYAEGFTVPWSKVTGAPAIPTAASDVHARPDDWMPTAAEVGAVALVDDSSGEKTAVTIGTRMGAVGENSLANGSGVEASGNYSHAEGSGVEASGNYSHAEGSGTTASGDSSHAEGHYTTASGDSSHAEGYYTTASGDSSHAEGNGTTASVSYSHAEGNYTIASGSGSHAEGDSTTASGNGAHAEGFYTTASGGYSHAEGSSTTASGGYSHAEGSSTTASGDGSHAEGSSTTASGNSSHVEGVCTTASGNGSHASGVFSKASDGHDYAFSWSGDGSRLDNPYQSHGPGTFNVNPLGGLAGFWVGEETLSDIIGAKADKTAISATDPAFSNAVLAVGLGIDTNSVAVLNEIAETFGGFPLGAGETATTVGGLLAALAAAVAWLKKNKADKTSLDALAAKVDAANTELEGVA